MGGNVVIGVIVFSILLVVNFMVITKGSGRIAEVAARFSLDAMPGKQMAIDADLSAGLIDEDEARQRPQRAGGGKRLLRRHGRRREVRARRRDRRPDHHRHQHRRRPHRSAWCSTACRSPTRPQTFTTLTVGDGLVTQIPALLVSTAAGIVVTKGGIEGSPTRRWSASSAASRSRWRWPRRGGGRWRCCRACRSCRSWRSPALAGGARLDASPSSASRPRPPNRGAQAKPAAGRGRADQPTRCAST